LQALTDAVFTAPMVEDAKRYTELGHDVFLYRFDVPSIFLSSNNVTYKYGPSKCL
jgi:carboxylesterase type B